MRVRGAKTLALKVLSCLVDPAGAMRVKVISRSTQEFTRDRSQDLQVGNRSVAILLSNKTLFYFVFGRCWS